MLQGVEELAEAVKVTMGPKVRIFLEKLLSNLILTRVLGQLFSHFSILYFFLLNWNWEDI